MVTEEITGDQIDSMGLRRLGLQPEPRNEGGFAVLEVRADSGAGKIGIEPGDIVVGINGEGLTNLSVLRRVILGLRGRSAASGISIREFPRTI